MVGDTVYSNKSAESGLVGWQFECRKCLPCRLNLAREKAVRALHESKMHDSNIFLTLTYDEENLESNKLIYEHFQTFMKDLRNTTDRKISMMVTGEYGEKNKRPHWHALLFNYEPPDSAHKYTTDRGDRVYSSKSLETLWGKGQIEYGDVTIDSASYVARYAAKKLVHGKDDEHQFHPIHKTSSANAIGKTWIKKYYKQTFDHGYVTLPNGSKTSIPRYYVDWLKKHHEDVWIKYVTETRPKIIKQAEEKQRKEDIEYMSDCMSNYKGGAEYPLSRAKVKETILKSKFKRLQENLKL